MAGVMPCTCGTSRMPRDKHLNNMSCRMHSSQAAVAPKSSKASPAVDWEDANEVSSLLWNATHPADAEMPPFCLK
eukprot:1075696-Pelagomonas_calceolata.AAC.3